MNDLFAAHTRFLQQGQAILAALPNLLLPWYDACKRDLPWRRTHDPYAVFVSEIMLQQTRVAAVIDYYKRFTALFPTVFALSKADDETLLKAWEGLGYYSRARNLKRAAQVVCDTFGGAFPRDPAVLETLPGVGKYTAGAVASIAYNVPVAAVDGNVIRIVSRLLAQDFPADEAYKRALTQALTNVHPKKRCGDFTQSFMDLGSMVCLPREPQCAACPLLSVCRAYKNGTAALYPIRPQKNARKTEQRTVFVLRFADCVAVRKRPNTGILAGLWELPNQCGHLSEQEAMTALDSFGAEIAGAFAVRHRKHVFTHLTWDMLVYDVTLVKKTNEFVFTHPQGGAARHTAFRVCL